MAIERTPEDKERFKQDMERIATSNALKARIHWILNQVGQKGVCRGCGAEVIWIRTRNGKPIPMNASGETHFVDCPRAKEFRRKKDGEAGKD